MQEYKVYSAHFRCLACLSFASRRTPPQKVPFKAAYGWCGWTNERAAKGLFRRWTTAAQYGLKLKKNAKLIPIVHRTDRGCRLPKSNRPWGFWILVVVPYPLTNYQLWLQKMAHVRFLKIKLRFEIFFVLVNLVPKTNFGNS